MAEPRRPRIIRSRPGAPVPEESGPPEQPATPGVVLSGSGKVTQTPLPEAMPRPGTPGESPVPAKTARAGSAKVSVTRLSDEAPAPAPRAAAVPRRPRKAQAGPAAEGPPGRGGSPGDTRPVPPTPGPPAAAEEARILRFPRPAHKVRRQRTLLTVLGVVAVVALIMSVALFSPVLGVKTVSFDGQKLVSDATLQAAVQPVLGRPLPQVTQAEVGALLAEVTQLKSVTIEARPPATLLVHVVERVPVALLKTAQEYVLVDQDGVQLAVTADPAAAAVPLIDGGTDVIGKDTFAAMTAVLATLPQSVLSMLASASASSPDAVELQLSDGRTVVWGNASDMELKAQVLDALLLAPAPTAAPGKEAPAAVKVYDVSAPRHPVTR